MIYHDACVALHADPEGRGRFIVVGDIHGRMDLLMRLVRLIGYDPFIDRMISLGDLVDRGPDSAEAVRWFAGGTLRTALLGNHDAMLLASEFDGRAAKIWNHNGGQWSEQHDPFDLNLLRRLVSGFPLSVELHLANSRKIGLVHAEVRPGATWHQVRTAEFHHRDAIDDFSASIVSSLLWGRQRCHTMRALSRLAPGVQPDAEHRPWIARVLRPVRGVDLIICGHTILPAREPLRFGSHLFIDTGAYQAPDGRLTAVDPEAGVYWQVGQQPDEQWGPLALPEPTRAPSGRALRR
ncbi:MAG: metallophosphoesterase [Pseudomonadota bacterium]|nr:metallophosphoesterase [Pseudomonadota bacterium]